jgi:GT2 family glycosyltransferase
MTAQLGTGEFMLKNQNQGKIPRVFLIILNWNGWRDTVECLASCQQLTWPNFKILVVDNGSSDDSEAQLRERFPDLDILQTGSNLGFAGGNNVGIRYALEQGAEYIWLLNNDTTVDPNALSALVDALAQNAGAGMAVSKITYFTDPERLWFAGGEWAPSQHLALHRGLDERDAGQYDIAGETDFATGCSLLFRASLVAAAGYLAEEYFLYWEDVDWSVRAKKRGWKILYVPGSRVRHKVSASVENNSAIQTYYYFRGGLLFYRRHSPGSMLSFAVQHMAYALNQYCRGRKHILRGYWAGMADFFLKRFGKGNPRP